MGRQDQGRRARALRAFPHRSGLEGLLAAGHAGRQGDAGSAGGGRGAIGPEAQERDGLAAQRDASLERQGQRIAAGADEAGLARDQLLAPDLELLGVAVRAGGDQAQLGQAAFQVAARRFAARSAAAAACHPGRGQAGHIGAQTRGVGDGRAGEGRRGQDEQAENGGVLHEEPPGAAPAALRVGWPRHSSLARGAQGLSEIPCPASAHYLV